LQAAGQSIGTIAQLQHAAAALRAGAIGGVEDRSGVNPQIAGSRDAKAGAEAVDGGRYFGLGYPA
jgi:hypothetical protein